MTLTKQIVCQACARQFTVRYRKEETAAGTLITIIEQDACCSNHPSWDAVLDRLYKEEAA